MSFETLVNLFNDRKMGIKDKDVSEKITQVLKAQQQMFPNTTREDVINTLVKEKARREAINQKKQAVGGKYHSRSTRRRSKRSRKRRSFKKQVKSASRKRSQKSRARKSRRSRHN